jgi:hypothetical protein
LFKTIEFLDSLTTRFFAFVVALILG